MTEPHTELCPRCKGNGSRWAVIDGVRTNYTCGTCKGLGEKSYAASAEKRAHTNAKAKERKARKLAEAIQQFKDERPAVWGWMERSAVDTFGASLRAGLLRYGSLTDKQLTAARNAAWR